MDEKFENMLVDYLDGTLDATQAAQVKQRLDRDPQLAAQLDALSKTMELLHGLPELDPPLSLRGRVMEATVERASFWGWLGKTLIPSRQAPWAAIAAGAIACTVLMVVLTVPDLYFNKPSLPTSSYELAVKTEPPMTDKIAAMDDQETAEDETVTTAAKKKVASKKLAGAKIPDVPVGESSGLSAVGAAGAVGGGRAVDVDSMAGEVGDHLRSSRDEVLEEAVSVSDKSKSRRGPERAVGFDGKAAKPDSAPPPPPPAVDGNEAYGYKDEGLFITKSTRLLEKKALNQKTSETIAVRKQEDRLEPAAPVLAAPAPKMGGADMRSRNLYEADVTPVSTGRSRGGLRSDLDDGPALEAENGDREAAASRQNQVVKSLKILARYEGAYSGIKGKGTAFVTQPSRWNALWGKVHSIATPAKPAPAVDFSKSFVVGIFMGTARTGGYAVRIQKVEFRQGQLVVLAHVTRPMPGQIVTQALTQPYSLVAVQIPSDMTVNADTPVEFIYQ